MLLPAKNTKLAATGVGDVVKKKVYIFYTYYPFQQHQTPGPAKDTKQQHQTLVADSRSVGE